MSNNDSDIEVAVMRSLCDNVNSHVSRLAKRSISSAHQGGYLKIDVVPSTYSCPKAFSKDYLIYSFLRKWTGLNTGIDTADVAIGRWHTAEQLCAKTNRRLDDISDLPERALDFITKCQRKIIAVIGQSPDVEAMAGLCKWGSGATFDLRRSGGVDIATKMLSEQTVTLRALPHLICVLDAIWLEVARTPIVVPGNRCVTVPKDAKTDRMIAAEPTANSFLQQGVGRYIRARLKRFGINLDDQSVNQGLAFAALIDGLATIDLAMASDTMSRSLVHLLLPPAWAEYLEDLRSPLSQMPDGRWYKLEKFSSMGNAYTFELESLLFWVISSVACGEDAHLVKVYGDDIVVPQKASADVIAALAFFGFGTNREKSYTEGSFFESCGKHYFDLEDVTPAYQKAKVGKDLGELVAMYNRLYRWGKRNCMEVVKDSLGLITEFTSKMHPKLTRLPRVPDRNVGDAGFLTPDLVPNRHGDYRCFVLQRKSIVTHMISNNDHVALYAYKLRRPIQSNLIDTGAPGLECGESTCLTWVRVWASSLIG